MMCHQMEKGENNQDGFELHNSTVIQLDVEDFFLFPSSFYIWSAGGCRLWALQI